MSSTRPTTRIPTVYRNGSARRRPSRAGGAGCSPEPRSAYCPLEEQHPTCTEDPYSLSNWTCEAQADSFARRYEDMVIASMRCHWVVPSREVATQYSSQMSEGAIKHLW